jgi:hypothetical protein
MTKLKDAGIFAATSQAQEEPDETEESKQEPEQPQQSERTRPRKKEAL